MEDQASGNTSVAGLTRPRISGTRLRWMPVMNRDQVGVSIVTIARTNRARAMRMPTFMRMRLRFTSGGGAGMCGGVFCVLVTRASDELRACPDTNGVDDQDSHEDDDDQGAESGVIEEVQVTLQQLPDAAGSDEADDDRSAHVD